MRNDFSIFIQNRQKSNKFALEGQIDEAAIVFRTHMGHDAVTETHGINYKGPVFLIDHFYEVFATMDDFHRRYSERDGQGNTGKDHQPKIKPGTGFPFHCFF